jgi:hypothetical protein
MAKKSNTRVIVDGIAGQHLALSVAAHLARTQLVADPLKVYDGKHLVDMLNVVAGALSRTAPLYIQDASTGLPRQLSPEELLGANVIGGGTLALKDGRTYAGATMRRADLRQAIAILKAVGLDGMSKCPASPDQPTASTVGNTLRERFMELQELLKAPLIPVQVERAKKLAVSMARDAPQGRVANLAMQLISALHGTNGMEDIPGGFRLALARLSAAVADGEKADK